MKQIYLFILLMCAMIMAPSCSEDREYTSPANGSTGAETTISAKAILPGMLTGGTRAVSENEVVSIDALVFDAASSTYLYRAAISNTNFTATPITFDVKLVATTTPVRVHYFANASDEIDATESSFTAGTTTEDMVRQAIYKTDVDAAGITSAQMMMWGLGEYNTVASGTINGVGTSTSPVTVNLLRSTARIDVGLGYDDTDGGWEGLSNFELAGVYVYNVAKGGYAAPGLNNFDKTNNKVTASTLYEQGNYLTRYELAEADGNSIEKQIYVYERSTGDGIDNSGSDPELFLIIAGYYNGSKTLCYYRTDLLDSNNDNVALLRNHHYRLNVAKISGQGYNTIESAIKVSSSMEGSGMTTTLVINDESIKNVAYAGNQYLSANYKSMQFYRNGSTYQLMIETSIDIESDPSLLTVALTDSADWLNIGSASSVAKTESNLISGTYSYKITYEITCEDFISTGTDHRTAGILIQADELYIVIDVDQSPMPDIEWEITPAKMYFYANGNPQYGSPAFADDTKYYLIPFIITAPDVSDPENATVTFEVVSPAAEADQYWKLSDLTELNDANGKTLQYIQTTYPNGIAIGVPAYARTSTVTELINVTFSYIYNNGEGTFIETRQISISQLPADGTFTAIAETSYAAEGNLSANATDYSDYFTFTVTSEYEWEAEFYEDAEAEFTTEDENGIKQTRVMFVPGSLYVDPNHGSKATVYFKLYENNSYNSRTGSIKITPLKIQNVDPIILYIVQDGYPPYIKMFYEPTNDDTNYVETTSIDFTPYHDDANGFEKLNQYFGSNALWEWPSQKNNGNTPDADYIWYNAQVKTNAYKWAWEYSDEDTYKVILNTNDLNNAVPGSYLDSDYSKTIEPRDTWTEYYKFIGNYDKSPAALTHTNTLTFTTDVDEVVDNAITNVVLKRTVPVRWNWGNEILSNVTYYKINSSYPTDASNRTHYRDGFYLRYDTSDRYPDAYNNGVSLTPWVDEVVPRHGWYFTLTLYVNSHFAARTYTDGTIADSGYDSRTYGSKTRSFYVTRNDTWANRQIVVCAAISDTNTSSKQIESPDKANFTQYGYDFEVTGVAIGNGKIKFTIKSDHGYPAMKVAIGSETFTIPASDYTVEAANGDVELDYTTGVITTSSTVNVSWADASDLSKGTGTANNISVTNY